MGFTPICFTPSLKEVQAGSWLLGSRKVRLPSAFSLETREVMRWLRGMSLTSGDDPDDPFVVPHSRIHVEESFLNDIILHLLGLTIICLLF